MATGENAGTWGTKTNTNLQLVQQAIGGFEQVTVGDGATVALAMTDGTISNARNMVVKVATVTLSGATVLTVPDSIEKMYIFDVTAVTNPTNLTIKTASGTGFSPDQAKIYFAYSNGTNIVEVSLDSLGGAIGTASLPTVPITKGGTGLTSAGSANQALKMNSGGSALEFGTLPIAGGGTGATTLAGANIVASNANTTFTKALRGSTQTAGSQTGSVTLDFDTYQNFIITLGNGSNTLAQPTTEGSQVGQTGYMIFIQPSTGTAASLSLHGDYESPASGGIAISTGNNDYDILGYVVKADNSILLGTPLLNFG